MPRTPVALVALCLAAALATPEPERPAPDSPEGRMLAAAEALLATLDATQADDAVFPFDGPERLAWNFVPKERPGLHLRDMDDAQKVALHRLLQTGLSSRGYLKVKGIWTLEEVLYDAARADGGDGSFRDPGNYVVQFHGMPRADGPWGWRVEGHHVSLNWTWAPGQELAAAPSFLGAAPHEVLEGEHAGLRPLGAIEDLGRALVDALTPEQRAVAVSETPKPGDVVFGPSRSEDLTGREGLRVDALDAAQRARLDALVDEYVDDLAPALAARVRARLDVDSVHLRVHGDPSPGGEWYFRLHATTFAFEFSTQGGPQHVHTVFRDFEGDFGLGILPGAR